GILALHAGTAIRVLAGIARRADIYIERSLAVEGDAFVFVLPLVRQIHHDRLGPARRLELAGRHLVALDDRRMREIEISVAQCDPGRAAGSDLFARVEPAVAV